MVFDLARRLPEHGFRVRVIAAGGGGEMEEEFRRAHIPLAIGPVTHGLRGRLETVRFLRAQIRHAWPSVWHTHLGGDVWGGMAAEREGLHPWITTIHDREVDHPFLRRRLRQRMMSRVDHVVCISEFVRACVAKEYGRREDVSVIPLGVDVGAFVSRGSRPFAEVPQLVTIGRLVPEKGHEVLLRGLASVKRPWHLDVIGEGPLRHEIERLSEKLGLMPRVTFVGSVSDVAARLTKADVFCFPSAHEGQGIALLEAAASGVPIVTNDLPVLHETFDPSMLTFVDSLLSAQAWAEAIESVLADPYAAMQRARRAESVISERFTLDRMVQEYVDLYAHLTYQ